MLFWALSHYANALAALASMLNYLIVFLPDFIRVMKRQGQTAHRRARFQAAKLPESAPLHCCIRCTKTDLSHPGLSFRVTASGEDICDECREQTTPGNS
jgi:hypothetical protein